MRLTVIYLYFKKTKKIQSNYMKNIKNIDYLERNVLVLTNFGLIKCLFK
ncbi:hypothetical protein C8C88_2158 [Flavobacterium sp. 123]|mgnify:FL=1|jgi:hypothetical protein|nr:hypothetical protein C8C88_2158 [Flavobacterium sp. 123]